MKKITIALMFTLLYIKIYPAKYNLEELLNVPPVPIGVFLLTIIKIQPVHGR